MGAMAEAIAAYVQPLLDQTDDSAEEVNRAFVLGQLCWNLALLPEEERDEALGKMRPTLNMDDDEFEAFRCSVVVPMIRRHQEMFPRMHRLGLMETSRGAPAPQTRRTKPARTKKKMTGDRAQCAVSLYNSKRRAAVRANSFAEVSAVE